METSVFRKKTRIDSYSVNIRLSFLS